MLPPVRRSRQPRPLSMRWNWRGKGVRKRKGSGTRWWLHRVPPIPGVRHNFHNRQNLSWVFLRVVPHILLPKAPSPNHLFPQVRSQMVPNNPRFPSRAADSGQERLLPNLSSIWKKLASVIWNRRIPKWHREGRVGKLPRQIILILAIRQRLLSSSIGRKMMKRVCACKDECIALPSTNIGDLTLINSGFMINTIMSGIYVLNLTLKQSILMALILVRMTTMTMMIFTWEI